MPALSQSVIDDLTGRLQRYLKKLSGNYGSPTFLDAGGSAAVFRVDDKMNLVR